MHHDIAALGDFTWVKLRLATPLELETILFRFKQLLEISKEKQNKQLDALIRILYGVGEQQISVCSNKCNISICLMKLV